MNSVTYKYYGTYGAPSNALVGAAKWIGRGISALVRARPAPSQAAQAQRVGTSTVGSGSDAMVRAAELIDGSAGTAALRQNPSIGSASDAMVRAAELIGRGLGKVVGTKSAAPSRGDEAARVRAMGMRFLESDPGFASDLFAAADRHEQG